MMHQLLPKYYQVQTLLLTVGIFLPTVQLSYHHTIAASIHVKPDADFKQA